MARIVRAVLLVVLVAAVPTPAAAAAPTLGARISPPVLTAGEDDRLEITNRSTIAVLVTVTASDGWTVDVPGGRLEVDQSMTVHVIPGPGEAVIRVSMTAAEGIAATDAAALVIEARGRHPSPLEALGPWWAVLGALAALSVLLAVYRRRRREARRA